MNHLYIFFLRFLKEEGAYKSYMTYNRYAPDITRYIKLTEPQFWISSAFSWYSTIEGHNYWKRLSKKWDDIFMTKYKKLKYGT